MPTDSLPKKPNDIIENIIARNYTELTQSNFQEILNLLVIDLKCDEDKVTNLLFNPECATSEGKNLITHLYLKMLLTKGLNTIFNFFTKYIIANIKTLSDEIIKKLIFLGTHYVVVYEDKISNVNSKFSENDIQTTKKFIKFLTSLLKINNITEFETSGLNYEKNDSIFPNITFGGPQKIDTLIVDTIKLSENLTYRLSFNHYNHTENSLKFLKSLGNLGFELKRKETFQNYSRKVPEIAKIFISSINFKNFSNGDAGYAFLSGFNGENTTQIKTDCVDLLGLKDCPRPVTLSVQLFQQIVQGSYINQKPPLTDFTLVKNEINIDTLNHEQHFYIITFLKNFLKNNSESDLNFQWLYRFALKSIDKLTKDLLQKNNLDHSFAQAAKNLSFFLLNLVKKNINNQDLHDQVHVITQFSKLYENIITQAPLLTSLSNTIGNHLFSILARNIDSEKALASGHNDFIALIKNLNQVCSKNQACNSFKILALSFKSLGSMSRKSEGHYAINATHEAQELLSLARLASNQLGDAASFFFKANIKQHELDLQCKQIFNLTDCKPANLTDLDLSVAQEEHDVDIMASINATEIINSTMPTGIVSDNIATKLPNYSNHTSLNQTENALNITTEFPLNSNNTNLNPQASENNLFPLLSKIGTASGLGAFTGFLNGGSQIILHIAEQKKCSLPTRLFLGATLAFANSFAISSLPLIYSIVENLANDETNSLVNSQKLLTCSYAFLTSIFLQGVYAGIKYASPKKSILKNLFNMLPLFAGLWITAITKEGGIEAVAILGTHILTSMATSSLTYFGLTRCIPAKNRQQFDTETNTRVQYNVQNNDIELLQPLQNDTNRKNIFENDAAKKTHQYICLPELKEVKKLSTENLNQLKNLIQTLEINIQNQEQQKKETNTSGILNALEKSIKDNNHILNILKAQFEPAETFLNLLNDNIHLKACEMYSSKQKRDFVDAMEKLGNVFKLMENNFKNLQGVITAAIGYTDAASDSFSEKVKIQLQGLSETIIFPLSKVTLYKDRYSNANAIEKTEQRCKTKANENLYNALINADQSIKRRTNTKINKDFNTNRNTFAFSRNSGSDSDLIRISTTSSSGESEFSNSSGNSAHNPINQQQKSPLLNGASFRV